MPRDYAQLNVKRKPMIWIKKQFKAAEFAPAQDLLERFMMAMPSHYAEFLMVSTETTDPIISDFYIGLPAENLSSAFRGFERISESELPKEIDTFYVGDQTKQPFIDRFKFRGRK
jgi:hypothetical protein